MHIQKQAASRLDGRAVALMVLLCVIWGVQQVVVKVGIADGLAPVLQAGLRSAMSLVLLLGWQAARGGLRHLRGADGSMGLGLLISVLFTLEFVFLYLGLARTTASVGVLLLYTAPFFVALGAHLFIPAERIGARQVVGLVCAFAGVALAMANSLLTKGGGGTLAGDALVLAGALAWGATTVVIKATRLVRIAPAKVLLYQLAGSLPILLALSALLGENWDLSRVTPAGWLMLAYQGVAVSFVSYLVWFWLISLYPASRLSAFSFLTPLFGMAAGAVLLEEPISAALVLALVFVAAGLRLVNGPAALHRPKPRAA